MPLFTYKARNERNKIVEDTIQAANRQDAVSLLKAEGFQVFTVRDLDRGFNSLFGSKISVAEKATFCRFIATMLRAGLSLPESVEIIKQESTNKQMRKILADIAFQVRKGKSLSTVLGQYKEAFDPVFLTLIKAGEESGSLAQTFDYLAKQLLATHELSQKIKGALMYPAVIVSAMAGVGILMLVFVLPRISTVFLKMNVPLPLMTRVVLEAGAFVGSHVVLVLGGLFIFFILLVILVLNQKTRRGLTVLFTQIPALRKLMNQIDVARFSRTLATLIRSGVHIVEALNVAADSLGQPHLQKQAKQFSIGVSKGKPLSEVLIQDRQAFPLIMIQTIKAGEQTGSLEEVLQELAEFYEKEIEFTLKRMISLLEPILLLVVGVVVGGMVIMIIAPIYSIIGGLQITIQP